VPWIAAISPVALLSRLMYRKSAPLGPITVGHRGGVCLNKRPLWRRTCTWAFKPPDPPKGSGKETLKG
jgi:hypothetical protein